MVISVVAIILAYTFTELTLNIRTAMRTSYRHIRQNKAFYKEANYIYHEQLRYVDYSVALGIIATIFQAALFFISSLMLYTSETTPLDPATQQLLYIALAVMIPSLYVGPAVIYKRAVACSNMLAAVNIIMEAVTQFDSILEQVKADVQQHLKETNIELYNKLNNNNEDSE